MKYRTTTLKNEWMRLAYNIAKDLYKIKGWNLKTTPVAVLVSPNNRYISHGVCADGAHAIHGHCDRLNTRGTSYDTCKWCHHKEHAERKAIEAAGDRYVVGATLYIYGHYKVCDFCMKQLKQLYINKIYILQHAEVLFDRHNPNTVLGTKKQFIIE